VLFCIQLGSGGGDRSLSQFPPETQCNRLITTAAAGKVYRSNRLSKTKHSDASDADACLEWLPQETIVFNGAIYRQDLRIELSPGARWLGGKLLDWVGVQGRKVLQGSGDAH